MNDGYGPWEQSGTAAERIARGPHKDSTEAMAAIAMVTVMDLQKQIDAKDKRIAELTKDLIEYGQHQSQCVANVSGFSSDPCDCGFSAALAKGGG